MQRLLICIEKPEDIDGVACVIIRAPQKTGSGQKEDGNYYPFGLTMAGISDKVVKQDYAENKYRFNGGNELQNKEFSDGTGLEMYDASARTFDSQLGRFWQMDGLADQANQESVSLYHFAFDNPVRYADHDGKCPTCVLGAIIGGVVDAAAQVGKGMLEGKSFGDAVGDIDYMEVGVAALAGFVSSGISAIYSGAGAAGGGGNCGNGDGFVQTGSEYNCRGCYFSNESVKRSGKQRRAANYFTGENCNGYCDG